MERPQNVKQNKAKEKSPLAQVAKNETLAAKEEKTADNVISSQPAQVSNNDESKNQTPHSAQEEKKEKKAKVVKKSQAVAKGLNLHASKKHCMYICNFIKNKPIDQALSELTDVISLKRPIPFKGEIPHRKYPGMMSGRYPVNASKQFIYILKALKGNVLSNGMALENTRIVSGVSNWASRPQKRGGARFKRTHVILTAREVIGEKK